MGGAWERGKHDAVAVGRPGVWCVLSRAVELALALLAPRLACCCICIFSRMCSARVARSLATVLMGSFERIRVECSTTKHNEIVVQLR